MAFEQVLYRGLGLQLDHFDQLQWARIFLALVFIWTMSSWVSESGGPKAPFVGFRSPLEPKLLARTRFVTQGLKIMEEGYNRVSFELLTIWVKYSEIHRIVGASLTGSGMICMLVEELYVQNHDA